MINSTQRLSQDLDKKVEFKMYGVDEEILDGIDNDGDGWIDEDVK